MSRYERNVYFEKLVALKLRPLGPQDTTSVISIEDVVIYAEAVMLATEVELEESRADEALDEVANGAAIEPGATPATDPATASTSPADAATTDPTLSPRTSRS